MSTTTKNTQATKTVSQGESRYGTPEPQIALRFPKGTSYRVVKAALHKLAAEIELATPASERWCVNTEDESESGRVYLELADATALKRDGSSAFSGPKRPGQRARQRPRPRWRLPPSRRAPPPSPRTPSPWPP
jgi:hypothetical protein